jgi:hypothetical protein
MAKSPLVVGVFDMVDVSAPGTPLFLSISQMDNDSAQLMLQMPTQDATGEPLSGLNKLGVLILPVVDGVNPFEGVSADDACFLVGVRSIDIDLEAEDAGTQIAVEIDGLTIGSWAFAAYCED